MCQNGPVKDQSLIKLWPDSKKNLAYKHSLRNPSAIEVFCKEKQRYTSKDLQQWLQQKVVLRTLSSAWYKYVPNFSDFVLFDFFQEKKTT